MNEQDHYEAKSPAEDALRTAMLKALEQMFLHSQASTNLIVDIHARLEGAIAGNSAIAEVVDQNASQTLMDHQLHVQKELISHLFEKSHQYVTIIIGGAFAAYFTTLGTLASRFSDIELKWSATLMTVSLTIFIFWEIMNVIFIGHHTFKGDYGVRTDTPRWMKRGWYFVMIVTLGTALPAIGLSLFAYLRGLGIGTPWHCTIG